MTGMIPIRSSGASISEMETFLQKRGPLIDSENNRYREKQRRNYDDDDAMGKTRWSCSKIGPSIRNYEKMKTQKETHRNKFSERI